MALLTSWSLQSPDDTVWVPSISTEGVVTYVPGGEVITATPPVVADRDEPANVRTLSISNAGTLSLSGPVADEDQDRAALQDANGVIYLAVCRGGILYFLAPQVRVGDLVAVGLYGEETVPMLVKAIAPGPDLTATLTLLDAAPGVHAAAAGPIPAFTSHLTLPATGPRLGLAVPVIESIVSDERVMVRSADGSLVPRLVIAVRFGSGPARRPDSLEVQLRRVGTSGSVWESLTLPVTDGAMQIALTNVEQGGQYDLRLRALGSLGRATDWVTVTNYVVEGKSSAPPAVEGLALNGERLVWSYPTPPEDFLGFAVRAQVGNRTSWGDAIPLHDGLLTATFFPLLPDTGERTYLVQAYDTSMNPSAIRSFFVDWGTLATQNVVESVDYRAAGFPGTVTGGSLFGGDLVANSDTAFWTLDPSPFWGAADALFWGGTYEALIYAFQVVPAFAWIGGKLLLEAVVTGSPWTLEYTKDDGLFWAADETLCWSADAALCWPPASTWLPWPGVLQGYSRQAYAFRLTTLAGAGPGVIERLDAIFDMPDREELLVHVALSATGSRLPLTQSFAAIKVVVATPVEEGTGVAWIRVLDKEVAGPLCVGATTSGQWVTCHADVLVKGY